MRLYCPQSTTKFDHKIRNATNTHLSDEYLAANKLTLTRCTCDNLALQEVLSLLMRCLAYLLLDKAMLRQRNMQVYMLILRQSILSKPRAL